MIMDGDKMLERGSIWFTGCTHFGHENIITLASRPFDNVRQMDETLIQNWNSVVGPNDTVFHLGDVQWDHRKDTMSLLNGYKIFVRGNHDPRDPDWGEQYIDLRVAKHRLILFHYPIEEWDGWYRGSIHLHCHTHQKRRWTAERRCNVTVEAWDYTPVALNSVLYPNS